MSPLAYKVLHVLAVVYVFAALGALLLHSWNRGSKESNRGGKWVGMTHGIGLLVVLISGFGMLAKLGLGFGLWVWLKLAIWLFLGGVIAMIRRRPSWAPALWVVVPLLGGVAAALAIYKPGA